MKNALLLVAFACVVAVFFSDVLLGDRALITSNPAMVEPWSHYAQGDDPEGRTYRTDALYTYLPRRTLLTSAVREGRLPLWNPYIFCGTPFFADPQARVLYPVSLLLVAADPLRAMGYDVAIHYLIALIGMYLFLKTAGASMSGSAAGAFLYAFSSFFFMRMGHPTFVASASYIPCFFFAYEKARVSERTGTLLLVVFLVLGYLAGFPQVFLLGVAALGVYALWDFLESMLAGSPGNGLRALRVLAVSGLLSAAIVAVHLVPFTEFIRNSTGLGLDPEAMSSRHVWEPVFLLRSLFPDFFGNPVDGTSWLLILKQGIHPYNSGFMVYCGAGSVVLLIAGLALVRESRVVRSLLIILALAVGLAVSAALLKAAGTVLPLLTYSQIDRIAAVACFALAALSGMTFSRLASGEYVRYRRYFLVAGIAALIVLAGAATVFHAQGGSIMASVDARAESLGAARWLGLSSRQVPQWVNGGEAQWLAFEKRQVVRGLLFFSLAWLLTLLIACAGRGRRMARGAMGLALFLLLVTDVLLTAGGYYVSQPSRLVKETEGIRVLREAQGGAGRWRAASLTPYVGVLPVNTGQIYRTYFVGGRATIVPEAFTDLAAYGAAYGVAGGAPGAGSPAPRGAQDIACARFRIAPGPAGTAPGPDSRRLYEGDMVIYETDAALPRGFCVPAGEVRRVGTDGGARVGVGHYMEKTENPSVGTVSIVSYGAEAIEMDVRAGSNCFLVFQDTFYPGWRARVDGAEVPVRRTDIGFRAVEVGEGEHHVIMEFRPRSLIIGLAITCAGMALSVVYGIKTKTRRRA